MIGHGHGKYQIDSLAVGTTEDPAVSRMTIVIDASKTNAAMVERNLYKLVNVIDVQDVTNLPTVVRELALIKVRVNDATHRGEIKQIADMLQPGIGAGLCLLSALFLAAVGAKRTLLPSN